MGYTPSPPSLAVIICHHTGRLIEQCLASIQRSVGVTPEVIVVTSDPTYVTRQATLLYLEDGPAAKRNLAMQRVQTQTAVFLDDDVEVSPTCLYELWKFLVEHPTCGMAFAKIYKMEEGRRDEFDDCGSFITNSGFLFSRAQNGQRDTGQYDTACKILSSKSATCAISRTAFKQAGEFDSDYFILGEETDLAWRCWLLGWEIWYVPSAISWHAFGCESLKPKQDYYTIERTMTYGCRNYLSLLWTNLGTFRRAYIYPVHLSAWAYAALAFLLRGDTTRAVGLLRGLCQFLRRLPLLQRKRAQVQATRVCSDRDLWPFIAHTPPLSYYWHRMARYLTTQLHG